MDEMVFYFAYGSNADPERLRARVGSWRSRRRAWLDRYRLRFTDSVRSEGGGGAVVDPNEESSVDGVLFEITAAQLAKMDREEFDPGRDRKRAGRRIRCVVRTEQGPIKAELYTVVDGGGWSAPSEAYVGYILRGLEAAGHPADALERVRRVAAGAADEARAK